MGSKDGGGVFKSCTRPSLISSAISIAKAGDVGKPVLVKRLSHRTRVFSSACERICSESRACEREVRPARRCDSVDGGMENAFTAGRYERYVPDLYAATASCIRDSTNALWTCVEVFIVDDAGGRK
jgi:hypothetical protein